MPTSPLVSIIILNYNGLKVTDNCLKSVFKTKYPNFEVILVDNASTDGSAEYFSERYPAVKVMVNSENKGFSEGNNIGIRAAEGEYVALLNNDVEVTPSWLSELVKVAESDPLIAACGPKILSFYNRKRFEYNGAAGGFFDIYGYPVLQGRIFEKIEEDHGQYNKTRDIFWSGGCCILIRKDTLNETGLFDGILFPDTFEEMDLCWRILLRGYRIVYVPSAKIYHMGGSSAPADQFRRWYFKQRNNLIMMIKNYDLNNLIKTMPFRILLEIPTMFAKKQRPGTKCKMPLVPLKALIWILINFRLIWGERLVVQKKVRKVPDEHVKRLMVKKNVAILYFLKKIGTFHDVEKFF